MNDSLKKRLIGAVVLIAMAVIFIPMLLSGPDPNSRPDLGSNVPPSPDYKYKTVEIPLQVPAAGEGEHAMTVESPEPQTPPSASTAPSARTTAPDGTGSAATDTSASKAPAPAAPTKQATAPTHTATPIAAPQGPKGWVVQMGSFASQNNAFTLRDKLRKQGFTAFVEKVVADKKTVYRVRVGPESSKDRAEALRQKLARKSGLKGLVMHYP